MSNFKAIIDLLGLSADEAAAFLHADRADIVRWCETSDGPPIEVWQALVKLFDTVRFAAQDAARAADLDNLNADDLNRISVSLPVADGAPEGPKRAITAMAVTSLARVFV